MCRKLDPLERFVSSANDKADAKMKPIFEESGMDFFDQHPYTMDFDDFEKIADFYGGSKPLIFSEWGGRAVAQSEVAMPETVNRLVDLVHRKKLAGHAYWSWQDLPQFTRIDARDARWHTRIGRCYRSPPAARARLHRAGQAL